MTTPTPQTPTTPPARNCECDYCHLLFIEKEMAQLANTANGQHAMCSMCYTAFRRAEKYVQPYIGPKLYPNEPRSMFDDRTPAHSVIGQEERDIERAERAEWASLWGGKPTKRTKGSTGSTGSTGAKQPKPPTPPKP